MILPPLVQQLAVLLPSQFPPDLKVPLLLGGGRRSPAAVLEDVVNVHTGWQLLGRRRRCVRGVGAGRKVAREAAVSRQEGLLVGQDQGARRARRALVA